MIPPFLPPPPPPRGANWTMIQLTYLYKKKINPSHLQTKSFPTHQTPLRPHLLQHDGTTQVASLGASHETKGIGKQSEAKSTGRGNKRYIAIPKSCHYLPLPYTKKHPKHQTLPNAPPFLSPPKNPPLHPPKPTISHPGKPKTQHKAHIPAILGRTDAFPHRPNPPHLRHAQHGAHDPEAEGQDGGDARGEEGRGVVDGDVVVAAGVFEEEVFGQGDAFVDGEPVALVAGEG